MLFSFLSREKSIHIYVYLISYNFDNTHTNTSTVFYYLRVETNKQILENMNNKWTISSKSNTFLFISSFPRFFLYLHFFCVFFFIFWSIFPFFSIFRLFSFSLFLHLFPSFVLILRRISAVSWFV